MDALSAAKEKRLTKKEVTKVASPWKKRASAGPTIGERRQEPILRESCGNKTKTKDPPKDIWMKHQCRCGFLLGYVLVPSQKWSRPCWCFDHECLGCHKKRVALEAKG